MISRKTRLMSVVAVVLMLVSMFTTFVLPASADDALPVFDESKSVYFTSPEDYNAPRAKDHETYAYADYDHWIVANSDDWYGIVKMGETGDFAGKTIHLVQDVNMNNDHVDPVATAFAGTLNGHDFEFQNFKMEVTLTKSQTTASIGLFAAAEGATFANVGIANGSINVGGRLSGNSREAMVGAFVANGKSTSMYNCWNGADITVDLTNGGISLSGVARLGSSSTMVNCYNTGNMTAKSGGANFVYANGLNDNVSYSTLYNVFSVGTLVAEGTGAKTAAFRLADNTNGANSTKVANLYVPGYTAVVHVGSKVDSTVVDKLNAQPTVAADAYTTGELAWSLNENYEPLEGYLKTYYTMKDGKAAFGEEGNQTRKLTVTRGDEEVTYVNADTKVEIPANGAYVLDTCSVEGYTYENGVLSFTMPTTDVTVTYKQVDLDFSEVKEIVEKYAPYAGNFDKFVDGTDMEAAYDAALLAAGYESNAEVDDATVIAAIEAAIAKDAAVTDMTLVDTFTNKDNYNAPNAKDYEVFEALNPTNWIVADDADWRGIVEMGKDSDFAGKTIHLVDDIIMDGPVDPVATTFAGTLNGHGFAFRNFKMEIALNNASQSSINVGLFATASGATFANVGIDGSITVTGKFNASYKELKLGAFVGASEGSNASTGSSFYNCWNGADITADLTQGSVALSGIARVKYGIMVNCYNTGNLTAKTDNGSAYTNGLSDNVANSTFYNVFSAGTLVAESNGDAYTAALRFNGGASGAKANKVENLYAIGHDAIIYLGTDSGAKTYVEGLVTKLQQIAVADDAYTTGELAWSLNANYNDDMDTAEYPKTYYTLEDSKTVFGEEADQTRKVTFVVGEETEGKYYNSGEAITLGYGSNATYEITEGTAAIDNGVLTLVGKDVTINVTIVGANTVELQECYDAYADKEDYLATSDGKLLSVLLGEAKAILDDSSEVTQDDVDAKVAEFATLEYRAYPNVPLTSEFEDYSDAKVFRIAGIDDMNYVAENSTAFTAEMVLHFDVEDNEITVPDGALANDWNGVNAAIDGHGVTIIGVDYVGSSSSTVGDAWLGNYAGAYLKNITFKDWTATSLGLYGAVVVSSVEASTEFANLHFINCSAQKLNGNGVGILAGVQQGDYQATFTDITFEGCTLDLNGRTVSNTAFLIGRVSAGSITADNIYLNNNHYVSKGNLKNASGHGAVMGECSGATATFTDIGVFNTTCQDIAPIHGLIGGMVKSGATVTYTNIITGNNGAYPMVLSEGTVTLTANNVYTDAPYMEDGANHITTAQALNGYAAAQLNAVEGAAKWEIAPNATAPSFDTDGLGLPVEVEFDAYDIETNEIVAIYSLYTDTTGHLVNLDSVIDEAEWFSEEHLADNIYIEKVYEAGYTVPVSHTEHTWGYSEQNSEADTHTKSCTATWTKDGVTVACGETQTGLACDFNSEPTVGDSNAEPEAATHSVACVCGNINTVLCSEAGKWDVQTTPATCYADGSTVYNCSACGYTHTDVLTKREHAYTAWTADQVAEGATQTHSRYCTHTDPACEGEASVQTEACTYSGDWIVTVKPGAQAGLQVKYCDKSCGSTIEEVLAATAAVAVDAEVGYSGKDMDVNIEIHNHTGIAGISLLVTYDSDVMTLNEVIKGALLGELTPSIEVGNVTEADENGMVSVQINASWNGDVLEEGAILTLNYAVDAEAATGEYAFNVEVLNAVNNDDVLFYPNGVETVVEIESVLLGDINGDGEVSIGDAVLMLRVACQDAELDYSQLDLNAADVAEEGNVGDMIVNSNDVVMVLRYIAGAISAL